MDVDPRAYNLPPVTVANYAPAMAFSLKTVAGKLIVLFKLRVVVLLVLASVGGALLASGGEVSVGQLILLVVTGTSIVSGGLGDQSIS